MTNKEIRELSTEEILSKIEEYKEELFNLRFQQATGSLEKPSRIHELRKLVARMKTIVRERELNVLKTQALEENAKAAKPKPENILHKIVEGRLKKNFKEVCLNDQAFIKNPDQTVAQYLGNGKVEMMARFKVGEGIEKKEENFAAEVAAQMKA